MYVISVINYKGGVGKTTITANLSAELAYRGFNVLMIDLDPQANLTFSFIRPETWAAEYFKSGTIKSWFKSFEDGKIQDLTELIFSPDRVKNILKDRGRLDMIASHLDLINIDLELAQELGGVSLKQSKKNFLKVHRRLAQGIQQIESGRYDIIIIDCPPNFNIVTKTAIVASSHLLIPARPDYLSTIGIYYLINQLNQLVEDYNDYIRMDDKDSEDVISPQLLGIIFNMVQFYNKRPISASRLHIRQTEQLNLPVFDTYIRENKSLHSDTGQYGIPLALMTPGSDTARDIVNEIETFVDEFQNRLRLQK
ncbi:MAG: ParA family protein [Deltaproteobacteria bacterium]|nr:MAG: ParA family protein [Deltaproteobacteria bacterium]